MNARNLRSGIICTAQPVSRDIDLGGSEGWFGVLWPFLANAPVLPINLQIFLSCQRLGLTKLIFNLRINEYLASDLQSVTLPA